MGSKIKVWARNSLGDKFYDQGKYVYNIFAGLLKPLPDFIVIGAQKAGSTSLYHYLTLHPQIYSASLKEILFFDYNYSNGLGWYRTHFPLACRFNQQAITGEASPDYLYHPHAAERIASILPDIKLIVLLRNPVDRAISHYWWEVKDDFENLGIKEAFKNEEQRIGEEKEQVLRDKNYYSYAHEHFSYLDRGKYADQLKVYFKYFEQNKILVLNSERFFKNTQEVYDRVVNFLGLNPYTLPSKKPQNVGQNKKETDPELREELKSFFNPYNQELYQMLSTDFGW